MNEMKFVLIFTFLLIYFNAEGNEIGIFSCRSFSQEISKTFISSINREDDGPIAIKAYIIAEEIHVLHLPDLTFREYYEESLNARLEFEPFFGRGFDFLVVEDKRDWYHVFFEMDTRNDQTSGKRMRISKVLNVYESMVFVEDYEFGVSKRNYLLNVFRQILETERGDHPP